MALAFTRGLVVSSVVNDLWVGDGGLRGTALDMVACHVRDDGQIHPGGVPAVPTKEEVLSPSAIVTGEIGVQESFFGE